MQSFKEFPIKQHLRNTNISAFATSTLLSIISLKIDTRQSHENILCMIASIYITTTQRLNSIGLELTEIIQLSF